MKRLPLAIILALALCAALVATGCGEEEVETHVVEGEPLELGELSYNVQITRFLNPDDPEDEGYLAGQERPEPGQAYLGVFLTIENDGDEEADVPYAFKVRDTQGAEGSSQGVGIYEPIPSASVYALQLPGQDESASGGIEPGQIDDLQPVAIPADGELPIPDSTAAESVIGGAMLLFLVDQNVAENRPLELEVPGDGESGFIELDI
ncbi:MAG TPA: hypothetical protein VFY99_03755 [Solirubrobacterales bacterium]